MLGGLERGGHVNRSVRRGPMLLPYVGAGPVVMLLPSFMNYAIRPSLWVWYFCFPACFLGRFPMLVFLFCFWFFLFFFTLFLPSSSIVATCATS